MRGPLARAGRLLADTAARGRSAMAGLVLARGGPAWLRVRLEGPLEDLRPPRLLALARPPAGPPPPPLLDLLQALRRAAADPRIAGVLLHLHGVVAGPSRLLSLHREIELVRRSGKPVVAFGESLSGAELLLASAASRVIMPESGSLLLLGLRAERLHLAGLLRRLGLRVEVLSVGAYKTAAERFTREHMSEEEREQLGALLDDLDREVVARLAAGRGLPEEAVRDRIDRGPYTGRGALEAGLVDDLLYPDEVEGVLRELAPGRGPSEEPRLVDVDRYHRMVAAWPPGARLTQPRPRLAYLVLRGPIHRGRAPHGIACDRVRGWLDALRRDPAIRAVVVRLETPGGDAVASDLLHRELQRLGGRKPVVASLGDVAASGGYFLAAGCGGIVAEAGSVTGSIGVVGARLDASELLDRAGIRAEAIERGARAGLLSPTRRLEPGERRALRAAMEELYGLFVARVAEGRGLDAERVRALGGGRVYSGAAARREGLVDRLGGPLEAVEEAAARAGLAPGAPVRLEVLPRRPWAALAPPGRVLAS